MTEEQPIVQPGRMEITLLGPALAHAARIHTPLCALCYLGAVGPPGRGLRQGVHEQRGLFVARDFVGNKIKPIARRDARSGQQKMVRILDSGYDRSPEWIMG